MRSFCVAIIQDFLFWPTYRSVMTTIIRETHDYITHTYTNSFEADFEWVLI